MSSIFRSTCCGSGRAGSADQADEARRRTPLLPAGRRRPLRGIKHLLYGEGYTIRGVQRILREQGPKFVQAVWQPGAAQPAVLPEEEEAPEQAEQLAPDEAARTLFGLLQAPSAPRTEDDAETEVLRACWCRPCRLRRRRPPRSSRATTSGGCKVLCMNCENAGG
jgi:hypothetical protein